MTERTYLSPPDITDLEEQAVVRAIRSGWVAPLGPEVDAFEAELADYCGRRYSVALSSGTAALHLGLLTLGVGPGDLVLTSSMTFAATANAIVYTGAEPVFVDADETGNMNPDLLEVAFHEIERFGQSVKVVLPVDLLGKVAAHERIDSIAAAHGAQVLSDAAESLGAVRGGRSSASFGRAAAVSFNGNKIMTTSGGGAFLTDDDALAHRVRYLASQARQPVAHYEHHDIGYNYRMSNILAALGRAQLSRLNEMIEIRRQHRLAYRELFHGIPGVKLFGGPSGAGDAQTQGTRDNFWLTSILIDPDEAGFTRDDLIAALAAANIESRPLWKPMHLQPVYNGVRAYTDGTSERLFRQGISIPSGSALTENEKLRIRNAVKRFLAPQGVLA